jgi:hypothetical protein
MAFIGSNGREHTRQKRHVEIKPPVNKQMREWVDRITMARKKLANSCQL